MAERANGVGVAAELFLERGEGAKVVEQCFIMSRILDGALVVLERCLRINGLDKSG